MISVWAALSNVFTYLPRSRKEGAGAAVLATLAQANGEVRELWLGVRAFDLNSGSAASSLCGLRQMVLSSPPLGFFSCKVGTVQACSGLN